MKLRYLISLSLVGALLLGACGGGDDDDDSGKTPADAATTTTASDATKTSDQPTTTTGKTAEATKPATGGSAKDDLGKLAANALKSTYQATYDLELAFQGADQKGTAVFANKAPNFAAIMSFKLQGVGAIKVSVINDGKNGYVCTDFGAGGSCSKEDADSTFSGVDLTQQLEDAAESQDVKEIDGRTILGRKARCFEASVPDAPGKTTYCIDAKDAVVLALDAGDSLKMTATEVKTSVDEKLFELPYPVN